MIKETRSMGTPANRVSVNGVSIHYRLEGPRGRPVVTLSHSLATSLEMWRPQVAALAEHFQVLRYDMRGHGASGRPTAPIASKCWPRT
jgi:3-oxoadipate enol-lactonase